MDNINENMENYNESVIYNPFELINYLISHKTKSDSNIYFNKFFPIFVDCFLWKNTSNTDSKYLLEYGKTKERIQKELTTKKFSELTDLQKGIYLQNYKLYIENIISNKSAIIEENNQKINEKVNFMKILQDKISQKSTADQEIEMKIKAIEENKRQIKEKLVNKLNRLKLKQTELKEKIKKSQEIIKNYEDEGESNDTSIFNIVKGLKEENLKLIGLCEEKEIEIALLDKKSMDFRKDISLLEKTPNKINKL